METGGIPFILQGHHASGVAGSAGCVFDELPLQRPATYCALFSAGQAIVFAVYERVRRVIESVKETNLEEQDTYSE